MTIKRPLDLSAVRLLKGAHHDNAAQEFCLLEAAAYMTGEPWSDHPACVSPVIASFGRSLNDRWGDAQRQKLIPLLPEVIGTATGPKDERTRARMLCDWLVRVYAPVWLDLVESCRSDATALRALGELRTDEQFAAARIGPIAAAREHAVAAWAAARDAARAAAWAAAGDAAWDAAGDAARDAAWDAAWDAAGDAARAAARDAAWDAAGDAARAAAWAAAWDATRAALQPAVIRLQASAIDVLHRLCQVGRAVAQ